MEMLPSANTPAQPRQKEIRGSLLLLLAAVIWGSAFAAQRAGMDHISPFTFTAIRTTLGGLFMAFAAAFSERKAGPEKKCDPKLQRKAGLLCGLFLFAMRLLRPHRGIHRGSLRNEPHCGPVRGKEPDGTDHQRGRKTRAVRRPEPSEGYAEGPGRHEGSQRGGAAAAALKA